MLGEGLATAVWNDGRMKLGAKPSDRAPRAGRHDWTRCPTGGDAGLVRRLQRTRSIDRHRCWWRWSKPDCWAGNGPWILLRLTWRFVRRHETGIARQESRGPRHDSTPSSQHPLRGFPCHNNQWTFIDKARHRRAGRGLGQIRGQGVFGEFAQGSGRWKPRWPCAGRTAGRDPDHRHPSQALKCVEADPARESFIWHDWHFSGLGRKYGERGLCSYIPCATTRRKNIDLKMRSPMSWWCR